MDDSRKYLLILKVNSKESHKTVQRDWENEKEKERCLNKQQATELQIFCENKMNTKSTTKRTCWTVSFIAFCSKNRFDFAGPHSGSSNHKLCNFFLFWMFLVVVVLLLAYLLSSSLDVKCIQVYKLYSITVRTASVFCSFSLNFQQSFNTAWWLFLLIVYIDIQWTLWRKGKKNSIKRCKIA